MKAQSAVEFLTTYGFLLLILSAVILIIFFITSTTRTEVKSGCVSFSGVTCNFVDLYSPRNLPYTVASFSMTNSQNAPINVTNMTVTVRNTNFIGICSPNFLYQGEEATCIANLTGNSPQGSVVQGFYSVNAKFCNSAVSALTYNCTANASYTGSFYAYAQQAPASFFSVIAATGNTTGDLPAYNSVPILPTIYTVVNNGDWAATENGIEIAYALGTTGQTGSYFGIPISPFPQSLYYLDNNAISCGPSYNSSLSFAYTGIYLSSGETLTFNFYTKNAIAVWYKPQGSNTWNSVFGSTYWPASSATLQTGSATLSKGLESVAVEWSDTCGSGLQAFQMTGATV